MPRPLTTAYHMVDGGNLDSVLRHGLLSTSRLASMFGGIRPQDLHRHRKEPLRLAPGVSTRDQRPMPPSALARCLTGGLEPEDWYELLNGKVFFWLDPKRLDRQRLACGAAPQFALVVDAGRLLADYGATAAVAPINTGNAMRAAALRNRTTFVPYERWRAEGWADERIPGVDPRPLHHRPVELVVSDAVPNIMAYTTAVVPLAAGEGMAAALHRSVAGRAFAV